MPRKRALIPLVTAIVLGSVCFILTLVFTIIAAVNVSKLKSLSSRYYADYYDMIPLAEFCICLLISIMLLAPILSVIHLTGALDQKNQIIFMKANKMEPLPIPRKRSIAAMIEAVIILLAGFLATTFSGAINGWNRYNWYFFLGSMIIVFIYSVLHFVIACITLSIDDNNVFLATGSFTPGSANIQYNMPPAYTAQPHYPQQTMQYTNQQYNPPAGYSPQTYNKNGHL